MTDQGNEFVEKYLTDADDRPDQYELRVDRLEDQIAELQTTIEWQQAEIEKVQQETVGHSDYERLVDTVNGEDFENVVSEALDGFSRKEIGCSVQLIGTVTLKKVR